MRQNLDKFATFVLKLILPVLAFAIPLFFLPITPNFFDYNKIYLIYLLASISLIAWTVRIIARKRVHLTLTPATIPLLALSVTYILSSIIQSPTVLLSLLGRTSLIISLVIIFIAVTTTQKNEKVISSTIVSLLFSFLILSVISLLQYLDLIQIREKNFSLIGGIFPYLIVAITLLPGSIYLVFKSKNLFAKIFYIVFTTLTTVTAISQINLILTSGQPFTWPYLPFSVGWAIAIDTLKSVRTAILGTGPENFLSTFTRLRPASMNLSTLWNIRFANSSNELFNIISTTGILGGIFWLSAIIKTLGKARKSTLSPHFIFSFITLLTSFVISLIVPANVVLLSIIFISLTLTCLYLKLSGDSNTKDITLNLFTTSTPSTAKEYEQLPIEKSSINQILVIFFSLPCIILLITFWYFSGRAYAASLATFQAIELINTNAGASYEKQALAYTLDPYNPSYRINFSQTSLGLANSLATNKELSDQDKNNISQLIQQAIREAKNAASLDPKSVISWENLAYIYSQLTNFAEGAIDWTIASYNQAILLDPTNPNLRLSLGGIFYSLQDYDSAIKLFGQTIDLKPDWPNAHYNLASAYIGNKNIKKAVEEMRIVVQLIDPNSSDYQKAQNELTDLEKQLPKEPVQPATGATSSQKDNIELVTPTPIPSKPATNINLPETSGPEIPINTPSPTP